MTDDKLAAANQITSAEVVDYAKRLSGLVDIRAKRDELFAQLALAMHMSSGALDSLIKRAASEHLDAHLVSGHKRFNDSLWAAALPLMEMEELEMAMEAMQAQLRG